MPKFFKMFSAASTVFNFLCVIRELWGILVARQESEGLFQVVSPMFFEISLIIFLFAPAWIRGDAISNSWADSLPGLSSLRSSVLSPLITFFML